MKIAITSSGVNLDAPTSPIFGRCPMYVLVETETMRFEAVENPAVAAASGAGIQAAQLVIERGAQAVVTGNVGPNALDVFWSAGVPIYLFNGGTVRDAVEGFKAGKLESVTAANAQAGAGMDAPPAMGRGPGMGCGRGMRRGLGRGQGRRRGLGGGQAGGGRAAAPSPSFVPPHSRQEEITALKETASELQRQLAEVTQRLDQLQKEE